MGRKTPPNPKYPPWTTARYYSFIRSALRGAHSRWPPACNFEKNNRREVTGKRHKWEYQCSICGEWFKRKEVERDHIIPCGSFLTHEDIGAFVDRLLAPEDGYRWLCKPCHVEVTHGKKNSQE